MRATPIVLHGIVKPDGSLELEGRVPLPPGKVSVTLEPEPVLPDYLAALEMPNTPFFEMLRGNWLAEARAGKPFRTSEEAQEALRRFRDDAAEEVAEIGRLQEECRRQREDAESSQDGPCSNAPWHGMPPKEEKT